MGTRQRMRSTPLPGQRRLPTNRASSCISSPVRVSSIHVSLDKESTIYSDSHLRDLQCQQMINYNILLDSFVAVLHFVEIGSVPQILIRFAHTVNPSSSAQVLTGHAYQLVCLGVKLNADEDSPLLGSFPHPQSKGFFRNRARYDSPAKVQVVHHSRFGMAALRLCHRNLSPLGIGRYGLFILSLYRPGNGAGLRGGTGLCRLCSLHGKDCCSATHHGNRGDEYLKTAVCSLGEQSKCLLENEFLTIVHRRTRDYTHARSVNSIRGSPIGLLGGITARAP